MVFEIKGLDDGFLHDISINVRQREIVGLYGLMGSGCSEIIECAFGARKYKKGEFFVKGQKIKIRQRWTPRMQDLRMSPPSENARDLCWVTRC